MAFGIGIVALTAFALASAVLAACGTVSTTYTSIETSAPEPQITVASPPAPTATHAPTETPAEALPQEPVLGPEQPTLSVDQVVGIWGVKPRDCANKPHEAALAFERDGSYHSRYAAQDPDFGGQDLDGGSYHFDQDLLVLESGYCSEPLGTVYTCTATYHVFVAMTGDAPGRLRFVLVEDPDAWRAKYLTGKSLLPYRQE